MPDPVLLTTGKVTMDADLFQDAALAVRLGFTPLSRMAVFLIFVTSDVLVVGCVREKGEKEGGSVFEARR